MSDDNRKKVLDNKLALQLIDIEKAFGEQLVCQGINLPVRRGQVLSILGPSGCGKTVSIKMLIGLARAIITNPEIILYDEPTAGLDPINTRRIVELILFLQEKLSCTSIVIAHDMHVVEAVSHDVAFFHNGRVRQLGTYAELHES